MNDVATRAAESNPAPKAVGPLLLIAFTFFPVIVIALMVLFFDLRALAKSKMRDPGIDQARAQVGRVVTDLDQRTSETGVYQKVDPDQIKETDPWGRPLKIDYSQGGIAETVTVRSAGPDGVFHSDDDLVASGVSANFKGNGNGIKKNAQETSSNIAKGLVKGAVDGMKESIKESLPFGKKSTTAQADEVSEVQPAG
ncbi:MAG: hypothetical protein KDA36_12150 [Planctomycetaceae bacterium]|nr:hypothetical protein [Planctomycetaceae bacterium]